jgi:hypothetical protein
MEEEQKNQRLPKTTDEQEELDALATLGPAAVYEWIYGPGSLMAKKMAGITWLDLGVKDSKEGIQKTVDTLKQFQQVN